MRKIIALMCSLALLSTQVSAQTAPAAQPKTLEAYEKAIQEAIKTVLSDTSRSVRQQQSAEVAELLGKALKLPNSFEYPFDSLYNISIVQPEDGEFRLFTWQLFIDNNNYKYGGVIQQKNGTVTLLKDAANKERSPEFQRCSAKNWYGALYYNIVPFKDGKKKAYLLMGFDGWKFFHKRKLVDVLTFNGTSPEFGTAAIEIPPALRYSGKSHANRFIVEYSAEVSTRFNWDEDFQMVVFDHLILGRGADGGPANVPDGSYCGFKLDKKGKWAYVDKLFADIPDLKDGQAPIPFPKDDKGLMDK